MARRIRVPKYSLHKPTGQARVIVNGRHHYLGKFESEESQQQYQVVVKQALEDRARAEKKALAERARAEVERAIG
jgi:hypothetical protein